MSDWHFDFSVVRAQYNVSDNDNDNDNDNDTNNDNDNDNDNDIKSNLVN